MFDTIVAPITGAPPAAVAWVRLSGPESWRIASAVFTDWPSPLEARKAIYGSYVFGDDGLVLPFEDGHSYTGEESVEMSIHGSKASIEALVEACLLQGARMADAGEFTLRAFLNGRIDLTQAEGVRESCEAETETQLRVAARLREGHLRDQVSGLLAQLLRLLAEVEASVDFSEEIGEFDRLNADGICAEIIVDLDRLLCTAHAGRLLREGYRIAIVGPPNAGKSSLMNALLRVDRSIVTEVPGTTRDFVEERASFGGVPVVLIDTAGLRDSTDPVESIGIQRAKVAASQADVVWYVYDSSVGWQAADAEGLSQFDRPVLVLANKADLAVGTEGMPISTITRDGLDDLIERVAGEALVQAPGPVINPRHGPLLTEAKRCVEEIRAALASDAPDDLLSVLLGEAIDLLGQVTGETASGDMIERIFADFCIGK